MNKNTEHVQTNLGGEVNKESFYECVSQQRRHKFNMLGWICSGKPMGMAEQPTKFGYKWVSLPTLPKREP